MLFFYTVFIMSKHEGRAARPLLNARERTSYAALRRFVLAVGGTEAPAQLTLAGMGSSQAAHVPSRLAGERDPLGYSLFFAGFAEPEDSARICLQGGSLARRHGLRDAVQVPERAHVTLCSLNRHDILDQGVINAARAAAKRFPCPALPMTFDRACSFAADGAFMLLGDAATHTAIARLRRPLMIMLRRFGLKPDEIHMPHMTMVYNCGQVVSEQSMAPLAWTMRRFALVLSHVGNARHEYLGEWALPRP
jgi:RNA 2',3'-cyclic 3'-phosphodiesterase